MNNGKALQINFLKYQNQLRITQEGEKKMVFDPVRKKKIVLTPEELMRQLVLQYLFTEKKYPPQRTRVEMGIKVNNLRKRCDILIFDKNLQPWLLVECKSPKVKITQNSFEQSAAYNLQLQVPFLAVTNGLVTFCCAMEYAQKNIDFLSDFPDIQISEKDENI